MRAGRRRRLVACLGLLATLAIGCDDLPGRPTEEERPLHPEQVKDFERLYSQSCAGCHGADGTHGASLPLNNPLFLALADDVSLRRIIAQGVSGTAMPPFAHSAGGMLTDEQIDVLIREMRRRWGRPGVAVDGAPPLFAGDHAGDAPRGAAVYATYCASCHGPDGRGGPKVGSIVHGAYLALVSDQWLRTVVIVGRSDFDHPDWRGYVRGEPMTAQQVSDVVAWLAEKRPGFVPHPTPPVAPPLAENDGGENQP